MVLLNSNKNLYQRNRIKIYYTACPLFTNSTIILIMKKTLLPLLAILFAMPSVIKAQSRIPITTIIPSENTGQDYSPWLNDNTDSLVADAWQGNMKYIDVKLALPGRTLISKLVFFDDAGIFTTNPAYIYALDGNEKIFLGKFEGLTYKTFVELTLTYPMLADAIVIHKYSNNIPQKVKIYGEPYVQGSTILPQTRLYFDDAIPSENTGQNYNLWFNDNLDSIIPWGNANSFHYIDVTLTLPQRSKVKKFRFWDTEGEFSTNPCYFYAIKDTQKIYLGQFTGPTYNTWVNLELPESITADAILVHKYSRYIPQKIQAYGQPLLADPLDTLIASDGRLEIKSISPIQAHGMDFSPWLNDDLDSLVSFSGETGNFAYSNITLQLAGKCKIGKLSLFDDVGEFVNQPAFIYGIYHTDTTLLGTFTGATYQTFVNITPSDSIIASTILIRKYGNNIPQKINIYGRLLQISNDTTVLPTDTVPIVKIPIDPKRWYVLNNVTDVIYKMFDSSNADIYGGYGRVLTNYDAYYPVKKGEHIDLQSIRFYDGQGGLGDYPVTLSIINAQGQKITVGTFTGSRYNTWVGPYPDRQTTEENKFKLDSMVHDVRYLVLNCWHSFPSEIELYGNYIPSAISISAPLAKNVQFKDVTGINAFEWDFESPYDPMKIDSVSYAGIKNFTGVRHYMDWEKLESHEGSYTYSPVHSGGWNYDAIYERCKADGIEVLTCLKTIPGWLQDTYPNSDRDAENTPVAYGSDFSNPSSYIKQAKMAFQYIARYGSNTAVNPALLSVNSTPRWNFDDTNKVRIGLGLIKYIECDNERDKWWKGRRAYQTAYEYAANLSAFYDGHLHTLGVGVGVKNADSSVKVVMGGLASPDPSYVRGMIEWCKLHRGYKADGSVNLCWDIINYHLYSNDAQSSQNGNSTRGAAPEKSEAGVVARAFKKLAHEEANDIPVWITELGYDVNQGSPLKAIAIGNKSVLQTQADWNLRSALLYVREGIEKAFFYQLYDDNLQNPTQFGSMGFLNADRSRKPAADFFVQANKLIGNFTYKETLHNDPIIDRYEKDNQTVYALMIPDEVGRTATYTLSLSGVTSVKIYTPIIGSDTMQVSYATTNNGQLSLLVSETPIFVLAIATGNNSISRKNENATSGVAQTTEIKSRPVFVAQANPIAVIASRNNASFESTLFSPASTATIAKAINKGLETESSIIDAAGKMNLHLKNLNGNKFPNKIFNFYSLVYKAY